MHSSLKMFNRILLVPIELAYKIGVEEACLLASCVRQYGSDVVDVISDLHKPETIQRLINLNLLKPIGNKFIINYSEIDSLLGVTTPLKEYHPAFRDPEFIQACEKWQDILKRKNRSKTIQSIHDLFKGKTLDESLTALNLAIENKFVTIIFNEPKKDTRKIRSGGTSWGSGGSTNTNQGSGHEKDHLTRRPC